MVTGSSSIAAQTDILDLLAQAVSDWDRAAAMQGIRHLAVTRSTFSADDLHELPGIILPANPNAIGALFSSARKAGVIKPAGFIPSQREGRNGSVIRLWAAA